MSKFKGLLLLGALAFLTSCGGNEANTQQTSALQPATITTPQQDTSSILESQTSETITASNNEVFQGAWGTQSYTLLEIDGNNATFPRSGPWGPLFIDEGTEGVAYFTSDTMTLTVGDEVMTFLYRGEPSHTIAVTFTVGTTSQTIPLWRR